MIVGDVSPASSTLTTSAGEDVTLTMTQHYGSTNELRWRHNGSYNSAWDGQSSISILNVQLHHIGIYECYIAGRHHLQNHALMRLLVRRKFLNKFLSTLYNSNMQFLCPMGTSKKLTSCVFLRQACTAMFELWDPFIS